ncbi:MAG TPA: hypothetical protein IAC90_02630 [Candidatus Coproplasma stercorigallinarum]|nr:hypothetical protein [Candidatus Coproplasma stercorigallinarum]
MAAFVNYADGEEDDALQVLTLWQIDSFEGGRGSRAEYLRSLAQDFAKSANVYIEVTALSSDAARTNISAGVVPDIISYGAGFYGIESLVSEGYGKAWCRGAYCLIALSGTDFSAVSTANTVINAGKDNLVSVAALFSGLQGANYAAPTSAYVSLISGEYEFLLGTQRDVIRLQTRGESFEVKPLTEFNDLYQYISVLTRDGEKAAVAEEYINYVLSHGESLTRIGMLCDGETLYSDEMHALEGVDFSYTIPAVASSGAVDEIKKAARSGDINLLKSLLKPL